MEGNKYSLNSLVTNRESAAREVEVDRKFFCSELVAKAYRYAGIMEARKLTSSNFLPVHFTSDSNAMRLVEGASWTKEKIIIIDTEKDTNPVLSP